MATLFSDFASISTVPGLMVQAETRIRIGTEYLYGSLNTSAGAGYIAAYGYASVGLTSGKYFDIGLVKSLGIEITNEKSEFEAANVLKSGIYTMTAEDATLSVGVTQFDPRVLQMCMSNGIMFPLADGSRLFTVGGSSASVTRPVEISTTNIFTDAPSSQASNISASGITGIVVTFYDAECTSGLPWGDIVANDLNSLDLEFKARSVLARDAGNRFLSVYVF